MITDDEFVRISVYMKQRYGIDLSQKKVIIDGRLENQLKSLGYRNYTDFMDAVEHDKTGEMERLLVNKLTTNHTYFMREFEQFDYYKAVVLPWAKKKAGKNRDLRTWCGAASTGEEPYMIAMTISDFFGLDHKNWDTKVLATDLSTGALQQAMQGIYDAEKLSNIPDNWKRHFFKSIAGGRQFQVQPELRSQLIFRQFNLMDDFPFKKKMHTIFLRNVMIYFDEKTKIELVRKVYDILEDGGYLFIGTTETLDRGSVPFQLVKPSIFRKEERNG